MWSTASLELSSEVFICLRILRLNGIVDELLVAMKRTVSHKLRPVATLSLIFLSMSRSTGVLSQHLLMSLWQGFRYFGVPLMTAIESIQIRHYNLDNRRLLHCLNCALSKSLCSRMIDQWLLLFVPSISPHCFISPLTNSRPLSDSTVFGNLYFSNFDLCKTLLFV